MPRTTVLLDRISGNRLSDTIFSQEANIASNNPRYVEMFMMNTASTVFGPTTISTPVILADAVPWCGDVTSGVCYDYGRQYDQEDKGALIGTTYYGSSIRRFSYKVASPESSTEYNNQIIIHTAANPPNFASVMGVDKMSLVNTSTNNSAGIVANSSSGIWSNPISTMVPPISGKLGVIRSIWFGFLSGQQQCQPAPGWTTVPWSVRVWNNLASLMADPDGGDYIIPFTHPSNPTYMTQYGIYGIVNGVGCAPGTYIQPMYDFKFDLTSANIPVTAGTEVFIAIRVEEGALIAGVMYHGMSSQEPVTDYCASNQHPPLLVTDKLCGIPYLKRRFGDQITIVPN